MGKAVAGLQDETGDVFSTNKFLQNYGKLDNASKDILFGRFGSQFKNDIETIAKVSNKIREGSAILANPSGTAGAVVGPATISSVQGSIFAGKFGFAQGVIGLMIQANQAARLFTNPEFVNWLATNSVKPVSNTSAAIATLNKIYEANQDPDIKEIHDALRNSFLKPKGGAVVRADGSYVGTDSALVKVSSGVNLILVGSDGASIGAGGTVLRPIFLPH